MKEITFNASTANGLFEARGVVILLPFDGGKHKAVLQFEIDGVRSETPALVDFKTGRIIASKDNLMAPLKNQKIGCNQYSEIQG